MGACFEKFETFRTWEIYITKRQFLVKKHSRQIDVINEFIWKIRNEDATRMYVLCMLKVNHLSILKRPIKKSSTVMANREFSCEHGTKYSTAIWKRTLLWARPPWQTTVYHAFVPSDSPKHRMKLQHCANIAIEGVIASFQGKYELTSFKLLV